jgi:hypothetical protein
MPLSKRQVLAATVLTIIAVAAIAYAQTIMGTVTLTTAELVNVADISDTFPARSAGERTYSSKITLDLTNNAGFQGGEDVVVRVELVPLGAEVYAGFRSLVIQVIPAGGADPVATLTLQTPYSDFTIPDITPSTRSYDVKVIYATGEKTVTAKLGLKATIVGVLP